MGVNTQESRPSSPPSMAPFSNYISFIFFTTLLLSLQSNARDSQFFSKVTHVDDNTNTNNNNFKETEFPSNNNKKEEPLMNKEDQQQQPEFIPETENSYGLYGHDESTHQQFPSNTAFEDPGKYKYYNHDHVYNTDQNEFSNTRLTGTGYYNNDNNNNNRDAYWGNQNELSDTKYTQENNKYYYNNNNNNNAANDKHYYDNNNFFNAANYDRYSSYNNHNAANNRFFNGERQGMSDTRFLEGGKYFYDLNAEKYNPTRYDDSSNWNNRGNSNYFGNNEGYHGYNNAFQNPQGEFDDEQDHFEP